MAASDITGQLARFMVAARDTNMPAEIALASKHRILDTSTAMVSVALLVSGEMAIKYARRPRIVGHSNGRENLRQERSTGQLDIRTCR